MEKLVAAAGLATAIYGKWRLRQFLSEVILVAALALVSAAMISALLISAAYAAYLALLHNGMDPQYAMVTVMALMTAITAACALFTVMYLRRTIYRHSGMMTQLNDTIDAFVNGLTAGNRS
jgi:hypothetical protein